MVAVEPVAEVVVMMMRRRLMMSCKEEEAHDEISRMRCFGWAKQQNPADPKKKTDTALQMMRESIHR